MGEIVRLPSAAASEPVHLLPGEYKLAFRKKRLVRRFNRGVLELTFAVMDFGESFEQQLTRYYNVQLSREKRAFTARPGSMFVRDYCQVFGKRPRFDRNPVGDYRDCMVIGYVDTTTTDYEQKKLPDAMQYSVIQELKRRAEQ